MGFNMNIEWHIIALVWPHIFTFFLVIKLIVTDHWRICKQGNCNNSSNGYAFGHILDKVPILLGLYTKGLCQVINQILSGLFLGLKSEQILTNRILNFLYFFSIQLVQKFNRKWLFIFEFHDSFLRWRILQ